MLLRWVSMLVWALVAASAVFWGLRLFTRASPVPPQTQVAELSGTARGEIGRVLGVDAAPQEAAAQPESTADARFNLVGVVSPLGPAAGGGGVALISVDGKPPKAYKLGAVVDGQNVLQAVNARGASLGLLGGPALVALNIPPPQAPATGQLPPALQGGAVVRPMQPVPSVSPPGGQPAQQILQPLPPQTVPPQPGQVPPQIDNRGNQMR
jgi:general secretion pathway protein C